ncbi:MULTISPECIES: acetyl/propionyl/methylcrotonyl-CoA carboxylase subunit alpha [Halocynthiibacter]|uniref:Acetyl/propionyl/methylcrotonyl-CoA carboxylase subunit alpha n=1 Tax=Halocynthiibacter halioticoli TaxID=2986804 RepID=A0AAE3LQQ5_9RHOB|nr:MULTISPECIES: acetyl/propionyl/methylcrotonyl-CoA carboxylase subunit alpha [Halocynthiibacter]MCV6824712.1 acetyl/propionyl/methylcrotonyl-CoA carboxylase subunit alpha [Halocynthiibacter halioticoli]MCW4057713.1 acetyl/propionyl/methylcrotonyl-CoA carboxylase subunit alpha [Halocynthiibacter sp. SDUM655004]
MFAKILIANRGEIACRVIETARKMGVGTVAVYSDVDAGARHVALADQAVHIGAAAPAESYLRGDVIIQAALDTGAEAIHPGYGFLSENPEFVEAVEAAGLVFIGPSAKAIRAMGLKDAAKALMEEAGVPVVPGYHGSNQDSAYLAEQAEQIGYPVLIKAVAGGGGKGMRLVEKEGEFDAALASAQGEAKTAFGNADVLIEKYITSPRHIEVQVFGDGTDAVHLFERDCSLQRRHQKVIEEAPAPGMTEDVRAAMGNAAVRAAKAIGYAGAGTIEFIVDGSDGLRTDGFWFMEMNTRLQVEHPVTEAITGVDLVEWQLRVASGEGLPASQSDLAIKGHAFEARLYAEDVPAGFLPATGTLSHLEFPQDARIDTGVRTGDEISPWYDPMIAKLTTHGPTRAVALKQLEQALTRTEVAGSVTNLAFLTSLTRHEGFRAGDVDTGLIGRDLEHLAEEPVACSRTRALAALGFAGLTEAVGEAADIESAGFTLWEPVPQTITFLYNGEEIAARITTLAVGEHRVEIGEIAHDVTRRAGIWFVDGAKTRARVRRFGESLSVFWGNGYVFEAIDPLARGGAAEEGGNIVAAPMPGLLKAVFVKPGAKVTEGDRLVILEAMKMEHSLLASRDGVVADVLCGEGDQVVAGAPLIQLEEAEV